MAHKTQGIMVSDAQLDRIEKYPFDINPEYKNAAKNFTIDDNLEMGSLRIYDNPKDIISSCQPVSYFDGLTNSALVAETTIGGMWQQETVMIHNINCKHGYEHLAKPMMEHVVNYAKFYEYYQSVWISALEKEKWFNYASGILSDFQKKSNSYIFQIR